MNGTKLRYGMTFFMLTALIYILMELRYGLHIQPFRPKHFAAAAALAACSCLIHIRRAGTSSGYWEELFLGYRNKPGRIVYMDYLRVLAALLVILVHVLEPVYAGLPPHTFAGSALAAAAGLGLSCNLLFIMLSGALLLGGKEESVLHFYSRRFVRVLIPCFAYYLLYFFYVDGISALHPGNWGSLIRSFLSNDSGQTPHFWLVYIILMFYVAAPFFRLMLRHMTEPMLEALVAVIFILHFLYTYGPLVHIQLAAPAFLSSWDSIFLLGYYCTTQAAMKHYRLFMTAGLGSGLVLAAAIMASESLGPLVYNNAPPQMLFTCALFLFFRKHGDTLFAAIPTVLSAIGRYSFSILLVHWLVLHRIVDNMPGINGLSFGIAGSILTSFLLTLSISLVLSFLYDNTVVLCMDRACELLGRLICKRCGGGRCNRP